MLKTAIALSKSYPERVEDLTQEQWASIRNELQAAVNLLVELEKLREATTKSGGLTASESLTIVKMISNLQARVEALERVANPLQPTLPYPWPQQPWESPFRWTCTASDYTQVGKRDWVGPNKDAGLYG